ncbi:MAG TPA: Ig-like domain-containing protein [Syntrophomonas sp.]|nr:Ig-like domain-containing protein [Syntrophomonas sp.]
MPISQVRTKINGIWTVLTYDSATGTYKGTITAPSITSYNVNPGHYYPVTVEATNAAGTVATKDDTDSTLGSALKLTVKEITKPVIAITAPSAAAYLTTNTPSITFTVTDEANGSGIKITSLAIKIDGGTAVTNTSNGVTVTSITNGYQVTYVPQTALTDGSHTVTVNIQDNDGNTATTASRTFTVDTVAPTLAVTNPASDGTYTATAALTVAGNTNDVTSSPVTMALKLNGTDQGTVTVSSGSWTKVVTLVEGLNTIIATATDKAGKTTSVTRTIYLDTTVPTISAITITPNPVNTNGSFTISVTVS